MTDEAEARHQLVLSIVKNVGIKTALLVGIGAVGAVAYTVLNQHAVWWAIPAGVVFGGALGLMNFRWLAFEVERRLVQRVQPTEPGNPAIILLNILKLAAIFIIIFAAFKWKIVNVFGLVIGLSLSFIAIIWEGLTVIPRMSREDK